jgi:signal transduction histidine kinase
VSELLAFTRPMALKIEEIDCESLVRSVLALASDAGNGVTVRIRVEPAGSRVRMHGDPELLRQALLNIVLNGFQSMPHGGSLRIRICPEPKGTKEPKSARIAFTDEGTGIPEDVLPRIFEPFFTTKEKGTGLGLALAARIVEGHGGRITVRSKEGVGSTFDVHLPWRRPRGTGSKGDGNGS